MEFLSLYPWWSFFIILTIILSYIGFCAHLHIQNIVWGKLLLSTIVWAILAISFGLASIMGNSKRKKYERRDRHTERNEKAFIGTLLVGFGLSINLLNLCCLHKDFSTPSKNIEVNRS
ncbi:TPA: hypothetical protein ACJL7A_000183 [Neisseria meningitidis]|uniref:hypothetical protein n=1 Tax=Neisseria meningitidis TaxID=487 RepID=UPI00053BC587|nr:hypothetical protein [Neisseria meningitidis]MBG8695358.1 hypothetical protein [Neisseria meningitidis]MBG8807148.1 hypothetical protein [Neisseria meningitidis]MBG8948242.1 hypothetical protein [Neisseria meningitidis]MBG9079175.1 hypothetical protein [Neisseria meningitidis]MBG9081593.1 hypothetical protein [Neisseria meningitidis]